MTYQATLQSWHSFYSTTGQAAAGLVGLLFVGLALHLRVVVSRPDVQGLARVTLSGFAATLVLALFMLIPGQSAISTGAALIGLGTATCLLTVPSLISGVRSTQRTISIWHLLLRFGLIELGFFGVIASGGLLAAGDFRSGLGQLIPVTILLLVISLRNSWDVLVTVGAATITAPTGGRAARPSRGRL
ncbi:MAG: hypothetical protein WA695_09445 [Candidatus Dormiibacterota bacterium]